MSDRLTPVIGIDLGTTNSCVAIYRNDRAEIVANDVGERTTPSYVGFKGDEVFVGTVAKTQAHRNYKNVIFGVKRLIGKRFNDETVQSDMKNWPFTVVNQNGNPEIKVQVGHEEKYYCPEKISAFILEKLKEVASMRVDAPVTKAVITVPAYFNDSQRQATKDAGKLAGLEVLRLLNEPTAAAIAYALDKNVESCRHALIFDLGGGTFDVSIIKFENRHVTIKAIAGDTHLGGDDFDNRLLDHVLKRIKQNHGYDITNHKRNVARLRAACESVKRLLSFQTFAQIELDALINGEDLEMEIFKATFEDLNEDLFEKTIDTVQNCLKHAGLNRNEIDDIVLVGGSTRIPRIRDLLQEFFEGKALCNSINPEEAVALGAAIQAANLSNCKFQVIEDFVLKDVVPMSLGVETAGGHMSVIIERNTPLPAVATKSFTTARDNQSSIIIKIFEGENSLTKFNNLLGEFKVTGILPAPAGAPLIDETFCVDENGILSIIATDKFSGRSQNLNIYLDKGRLSVDEITRLMKEANISKQLNEQLSQIAKAKNELKSYCNKTLRSIRDLQMSFEHYNYIYKKCNEALSDLHNSQDEDKSVLVDKLKCLKSNCQTILELYEHKC